MMMSELCRRSRTLLLILGLASIVLVQGCFHSKDSTPIPDADPTGYYTGTITVTAFTDLTTVHALVNDNRLMLMSMSEGVLYDGTMTITGNSFTSTAKIYNGGSDTKATTVISGNINAGSEITGELTGSGIGNGTFTLTSATSNSEIADVSRITTSGMKIWEEVLYEVPEATLAFTITLPTNIIHNDHSNTDVFKFCDIDTGAKIAPINNTNLYNVSWSFIGCTLTTQAITNYSGLATTKFTSADDDTIIMAITGTGFAVIGLFDKL